MNDPSLPEDSVRAGQVGTPAEPVRPPLHARGRHIYDAQNKRFKLCSINWYGASDRLFVPGGLDVRHRRDIAALIRRMGFNSVRMPYSDEMVRSNPVVAPGLLSANGDLAAGGVRALDVFEAVVNALTDAGLAVIVNNHITQATWCCGVNPCDAAWCNDYLGPLCRVRQGEAEWIENWMSVMRRFTDNERVVGADLRNEVRGLWGTITWDAWASAAERAAGRLLSLRRDWLMIVEGIASANDLAGAWRRPVRLPHDHDPEKDSGGVVYSVHVYKWSGWGSLVPYSRREWESFAQDMRRNWAFFIEQNLAPVWVGEFGAPDNPSKGDTNYWNNLLRYLHHTDVDFGYWALNPRKPHQHERESYSLLEDDWETVKEDYRLENIRRLLPSM